MSRTLRTVEFPDADGAQREVKRPEVDSRWRIDRAARLRREASDAKRIERAEQHTARLEDDPVPPLGSTVRPVP